MLVLVAKFHSFLWLSSVPLCICMCVCVCVCVLLIYSWFTILVIYMCVCVCIPHISFIHSLSIHLDTYLGWLRILVVINTIVLLWTLGACFCCIWSDSLYIASVNAYQIIRGGIAPNKCCVTTVNAPVILAPSQWTCQPGNEVCFTILGLGWQSVFHSGIQSL